MNDRRPPFEIENGPGGDEPLLGLWSPHPSETGALSFGMRGAAGAPVQPRPVIWRANLAGERASLAQLAAAERQLAGAARGLAAAERGLKRLAATGAVTAAAAEAPAVSFGVTTAPAGAIGPLERELWQALRGEAPAGPLSFDVGAPRPGTEAWRQAAERFRDWLRRLTRFLVHFAWIETREQGRLVGRTALSWDGDCAAFWTPSAGGDQRRRHQRQVSITLRSRQTLFEVLALTLSLAGRVAVAAAAPGGVLAALPLVWRYINRMIDLRGRRPA
ncbi:MAG: hypothetical protein R3272_11575 [Candidatus Promineifilaceae bacterium]|nr:hypothetical protein [Candidatus Promineifilaceae bacterium]